MWFICKSCSSAFSNGGDQGSVGVCETKREMIVWRVFLSGILTMTHYIETLFHFRLIQMCECVVGNVNAAVMQYVLSVHLSMIDVHTEIFLGRRGF